LALDSTTLHTSSLTPTARPIFRAIFFVYLIHPENDGGKHILKHPKQKQTEKGGDE
jgi:hypothetical protein